jgi:hypothetical protein
MSLENEPLTLAKIFYYGRECLTNRLKQLATIMVLWILLPQFFVLLRVSHDAGTFSDSVQSLFEGSVPFSFLSVLNILSSTIIGIFSWHFFATLCFLIGAMAMAKSCLDYFDSTPSTLAIVTRFSMKTILFKGAGLLLGLVLLAFPAAIFSLTRVFFVCLVIMLPVVVVANRQGGFLSVVDTIFLRYANQFRDGKWAVFSQVMTVGGLSMSLLFVVGWLCHSLTDLDAELYSKTTWFIDSPSLLGFRMARQHLIIQGLEISSIALLCVATIPFTTSLYMLIQSNRQSDAR